MKLTEAQEFFANMNEHEKELYQKKKLRSARRREVYANMDEQKKELRHITANNGPTWTRTRGSEIVRTPSGVESTPLISMTRREIEAIRSSEHMRRCYRKERWSGQVFLKK